jgi:hypothetical protein
MLKSFVLSTIFTALLTLSIVPKGGAQGHAANSGPDPISGRWSATFEVEGNQVPVELNFNLHGGELTGSADSHHTGPGTVINGSWVEPKLAFTLTFAHHESIMVTGVVQRGSLSGEFDTEGRRGKWTAERARLSTSAVPTENRYLPYQFLIGEWDVTTPGETAPLAVQRFAWGPNSSYIWFAGSLIINGSPEPHFEGMLTWNGVHHNLDMLLTLDLKTGLAAEQGTVSVEPDGTVVRDSNAIFSQGVTPLGLSTVGPAGAIVHFRQTYKAESSDKVITSAMRETEHGWVATFPRSDRLIMLRRNKGGQK